MSKIPAVIVDGLLAVGAVALAFLVSLCVSPTLARENVVVQGSHHLPSSFSTVVRHVEPCSRRQGISVTVGVAQNSVAALARRCRPAL
jgi:hypothetical protein